MRRTLLTLTLGPLLLSACSAWPPLPASAPENPPRTPTASRAAPLATASPPSATAEPTPTATLGAATCLEREGQLLEAEIDSELLIRPLPYTLYTPPCYDPAVPRGYPVLILLHGLAGHPNQWLELGLVDTADALIASGEFEPFLIALPWHRTGIELETAVLDVLLPHLEDNYHALPGRTWRAIGGFSRGGGWALRIGFRNPGIFSAVGLHSPGVFGGDLTALGFWLAQAPGQRAPRVWIDIGQQDTLLPSTSALSERLTDLNVDHQLVVRPGDHSGEYWSQHLGEYLRWYSERW